MLEEKVEAVHAVPFSSILSQAMKLFDGLSDGHAFAASGVLPKGRKTGF